MGEGFHPTTADELEAVVKWAAAERTPLEVIGSGSKRNWGRAVQSAHTLRIDGITGVVDYEPAELVLTVKAGTPLTDVQTLLKEHNQELPFEPADLSAVLGVPAQAGTIGGVLATTCLVHVASKPVRRATMCLVWKLFLGEVRFSRQVDA